MMNANNERIREEIIAWVHKELGISPCKKVDERTVINSYIDGDDGDDFMIAFGKHFNVDVFNPNIHKIPSGTHHFGPEAGPNPFSILAWIARWLLTGDTLGGLKPLYVEDLIQMAIRSKLMTVEIKIADLRLVINRIFDHIENDLGCMVVKLNENYYWDVSAKMRYEYDFDLEGSEGYERRQLYDDWKFLSPILQDEKLTVSPMLIHVAPLLRYIGEKDIYIRRTNCRRRNRRFNLRLSGQYFDHETGTHYNYFRDN